MIKIGLLGASGKMGAHVIELIKNEFASQAELFCTSDQNNKNFDQLAHSEVIIDFSLPEAVESFIEYVTRNKLPHPPIALGSTGWGDYSKLNSYASQAPLLLSSNFSIGVFATHVLLKQAAPLLKKLGYKPSILDIHHIHKRDAPSGTALALKDTLLETFTNESIAVESVREGEVIGDHQNIFESNGDKIIIQHFAKERKIFARGAIEVALWLAQESKNKQLKAGFLRMEDFFYKKYGNFFKN